MTPSSSVPSDAAPPPITAVPWRRQPQHATLPATVDTLFGRDLAVAAVVAALRGPSSRLLVLTGPGGVGKTRLAIASASVAAATFNDGAVFVALAPVRDPALVAASIAWAVGIRDAGGQPAAARLAEVLADRDLLLVLDNFEHLLPARDLISALLAACPHLTVLMTSRIRPHLTGERDIPVHPLTVPDPSPSPTSSQHGQPPSAPKHAAAGVETIGESPAVRLFVDRARAIDPSFRLTATNAPVVAEICRRVDGLPLAIELAAAQTQVLSPAALLVRLDARLPLLDGGPRDQPKRLQTMRQAIGWSFDLLPSDLQETFQCLAVFVGGFGLDAAQAVCGAPLDQITALVDQSLLRNVPADDEPRCAMLETIREFGLEQLANGGAERRIHARHAEWCLELAATREPDQFGGRGQVTALRRLEEELPNLRAAFAWLLEHGEDDAVLRLAATTAKFMYICGHISEIRDWLETALARSAKAPERRRAWALLSLAMIAFTQLDDERMAEAIAAALPLVTTGHDPRGFALARGAQALLAFARGRFTEAAALAAESEAAAAAIGHRWDAHFARFMLAKAELYAGNLDRAEAINRDLIDAAQDEELYITSAARLDGATIRQRRGDHAGALLLFARALNDFRELGEFWNAAAALEGAATTALNIGQADCAVSLLGTADAVRAQIGTPVLPPDRPAFDRTIATARKALGPTAFAAAWAAGQAASLDEAVACTIDLAAMAKVKQDASAIRQRSGGRRLTPREREVLALLVAGQSDPQIGATLSISARTVESHVAAILAKLGQPSRTAAVAHAVRSGLV